MEKRRLQTGRTVKTESRSRLRKRLTGFSTVCIFCALAVCTIVAKEAERRRYPQVMIGQTEEGIVTVNGKQEVFDYTVPVAALSRTDDRDLVYRVFSMNGTFREEFTVYATEVDVVARDDNRAALSSAIPMDIVLETDRELRDEMQVMVRK